MNFKDYLTEFDNPQIYCDMDGVLADFQGAFNKQFGGNFKDARWPELPEDSFLNLPKMKDANRLWGFIKKHKPRILTATPRESRGPIAKRSGEDKIIWMKVNFGVKRNDVYTVKRKDKKHFNTAHDGRPNVLIDDHLGNIEEWRVGGGLGVHHTSADSSIKQLKSIGFK